MELSDLSEGKSINSWGIASFQTSFISQIYHTFRPQPHAPGYTTLVEQIGWFEYWQTKPLDVTGLVELVYVDQKGWWPIKWG